MSASLRTVLQFLTGLALCSAGVWLSLQAGLGVSPWDVLHAGVATGTGLSFGVVVMAVGVLVLGVAALLGVRPGLGTLFNVVFVGVALDVLLATPWLDGLAAGGVAVRLAVLSGAVVLLGVGCALYIGAGFGAGPRDSLMVAFHLKGWPIGLSRVLVETSVLVVGWLLGGPVGVGTVIMALGLGPATQVAFRVLRQEPGAHAARRPAATPAR